MNVPSQTLSAYSVFAGGTHLTSGALPEVLAFLYAQPAQRRAEVLIIDNQTGRQQDFDFRGTLEQVLERYAPAAAEAGRGRPRLGVTSREVSLLPRHWEWLERQGNASATLRRLIDEERRRNPQADQKAQAQAATDRFLLNLGGNLPGYQEATRALYAGNRAELERHLAQWPADLRQHALKLAAGAFAEL